MSRKQYYIVAPNDTFPSGEGFYAKTWRGKIAWCRWRNDMMCINTIEDARVTLKEAQEHNPTAYIILYETTIVKSIVR